MRPRIVSLVPAVLFVLSAAACKQSPQPAPSASPATSVPEIARAVHDGRRVLFVGLDGADWELLDGYIQAGLMPNLAALAKGGRTAGPTPIPPPPPPPGGATVMTGAAPP